MAPIDAIRKYERQKRLVDLGILPKLAVGDQLYRDLGFTEAEIATIQALRDA